MQRQSFGMKPVAYAKAVVGGGRDQPYRFTVLTDGLVRVEYAADCTFEDRASTFATRRQLAVPDFRVIDEKDNLQIVTDRFHLYYDKKPFSPNGLSVQVKGNITHWHSRWRYSETRFFGWNQRGTARTLDEADGRIPLEYGVVAKNGFAYLDDSDTMLFTDDGWIASRKPADKGDRVDGYLFAYGLDYKGAVKGLYAVSGSQPLLPRWSLGNWWSRYYKYTDHEYIKLMDRFREEEVPLSVGVLDMDWHLVDHEKVHKSGMSGWTGYTWDRKLYPEPRPFLKKLYQDYNIRITANDHPADGIAAYEDAYPEFCEAMGIKPSQDPIAFDITNKKYLDAYFDIVLKKLEDDGINFWWVDWQQGHYSAIPNVDPLWMLNHFHFLQNSRDNKRPITFSRYAGPGSHRYPVGFSGDTVVTWESLHFQAEFTATSSNIGYAWWSHDIGGHMDGYRDDELATRWVQLGVFSPILRLHSSDNPWNSKEPWRFSRDARAAMSAALRLRHRLVPYIYSANVAAARDDEPLVQPLYWSHAKRDEAYANKNVFYFGSQLLIAPLTAPANRVTGRAKVRAWLPPGRWVDMHSGVVYDGDRDIWLHRRLDEYCVLGRQGTIIPLDAAHVPENGCPNPTALEVQVVVGADGAFDMHEDDGTGSTVDAVRFATTPMRLQQSTGSFTLGPASGDASALPQKRDWTLSFVGLASSSKMRVLVDGKVVSAPPELQSHAVSLSVKDVPLESSVKVELGAEPQLAVVKPAEHIFGLIDHAQMPFDPKKAAWAAVCGSAPLNVRITQLHAMNLDGDLLAAIGEFMFADSRSG